jgi:hypothetical protein
MVMWVQPPHFYQYNGGAPESVIIIYPGSDPTVLSLLQANVGPQFAGADPGVIDPYIAPDGDIPQAQFDRYLAAMLDLRDALANVGNPDVEGAIEQAIDAAKLVATFAPTSRRSQSRAGRPWSRPKLSRRSESPRTSPSPPSGSPPQWSASNSSSPSSASPPSSPSLKTPPK